MDADNQTPPIQFLEKKTKKVKKKNEKNPPERVSNVWPQEGRKLNQK